MNTTETPNSAPAPQQHNGTSQAHHASPVVSPPQKLPGLITRTASERLNSGKTKPPVTPLFDAFWLEGELAFLFGSTNVGKSILAVQIADAISRGAKIAYFDEPKKPMRVCYFDFELTESQFFHRYSDENGNVRLFSDNFLTSEIDPNTTPPSDINFQDLILEEIERTIIERQIEVVVIDNLTALLSNIAETKNALELMHKLRLLKLRRNVSMLVIGHTPKRDLSRPLTKNDMAGSMHLMNFCDSAFAIGESLKESNVRYLKQIKTRNAEFKYGSENVVTFRIVKKGSYLRFELIGLHNEKEHLRDRTEAEINELNEKIIALHQSDPNLSYGEIARRLGTNKTRVSRVLKKTLNKQNSSVFTYTFRRPFDMKPDGEESAE
jgi:RecA-family ATPase